MPITVIEGDQRGDEGKGRFVDMLAEDHDIVARFNGGPNAGHTVILPNGTEHNLHGLPSGVAHPHIINVIGNGALVNASKLAQEIDAAETKGVRLNPRNLLISSSAHLILPHHISQDEINESGPQAQGSTKSGIGPCAAAKYERQGVRAEVINNEPKKLFSIALKGLLAQRELRRDKGLPAIDEEAEVAEYIKSAQSLGKFVTDSTLFLNNKLREGKRILAEGAQAFLLDVDHGMYPDTTSSSPTAGGAATGLGIPPKSISQVIGVAKAIQSHVGGGHFVTEIHDEELLARLHGKLDAVDAETGTTTGRTRRLGYLDLPGIRRSHMVNGTDEMALTKVDWVPRFRDPRFDNRIPVCVAYTRKGKNLRIAPDAAYKLEQSEPVFEYLPSWTEDIQNVRFFGDLPDAAQAYIKFIDDQIEPDLTMIGVGPRRDQVIIRERAI